MIIQHNLSALNINNRLKINSKNIAKSTEKLSSGLRINKAADDAAGLAISEKMRAQIRGLNQAQRNVQDSISLIQTAEGGLSGIIDPPLQRMRQLAVQAANGTLTDDDRRQIQLEIEQIIDGIDSIANNTHFNRNKLLDGTFCGIDSIVTPAVKSMVTGGVYIGMAGLTITAGMNDTLTFDIDGVSKSITLADGSYNSISLLTEINNKLSSIGVSASYSNTTYGYLSLIRDTAGTSYTIDNISGNASVPLFMYRTNGYVSTFNVQGWTDLYPSVTIAAGLNDTLSFDIDGAGYSITIGAGTYSTTVVDQTCSFVQAINTALNNSSIPAKALLVGVVGDATDPQRILRFEITESEGAHTFGNVGGSARSLLMDELEISPHTGMDASGTISGSCDGYPSVLNGNVDISAGVNIISGVNDTLYISIDGTVKSITLAEGTYDSTSLLTEINDKLSTAGANITATMYSNILKLTHNLTGSTHTIDSITGNAVSTLLIKSVKGSDAVIIDGQDIDLQVGANSGESFKININDMKASALGINNVDVTTQSSAGNAISLIDFAIQKVSTERSKMGAFQNRLEHIQNNLSNYEESLTAAEARIRDTDIAKEMINYTKNNILIQSAQSMLAQANQLPKSVLQLLK